MRFVAARAYKSNWCETASLNMANELQATFISTTYFTVVSLCVFLRSLVGHTTENLCDTSVSQTWRLYPPYLFICHPVWRISYRHIFLAFAYMWYVCMRDKQIFIQYNFLLIANDMSNLVSTYNTLVLCISCMSKLV